MFPYTQPLVIRVDNEINDPAVKTPVVNGTAKTDKFLTGISKSDEAAARSSCILLVEVEQAVAKTDTKKTAKILNDFLLDSGRHTQENDVSPGVFEAHFKTSKSLNKPP